MKRNATLVHNNSTDHIAVPAAVSLTEDVRIEFEFESRGLAKCKECFSADLNHNTHSPNHHREKKVPEYPGAASAHTSQAPFPPTKPTKTSSRKPHPPIVIPPLPLNKPTSPLSSLPDPYFSCQRVCLFLSAKSFK